MGARRTFGLAHTTFCGRFPNLVNSKKAKSPKSTGEAAYCFCSGMKCRFLGLQICDQRLNPFNRDLIANRQEHSPVMLDLFVEFGAGVAHGEPVQPRTKATLIGCLLVKTCGREICSIKPSVKLGQPCSAEEPNGRFNSVTTAPAMIPIR